MRNVTKEDLSRELSKRIPGLSNDNSDVAVAQLADMICECLMAGLTVNLGPDAFRLIPKAWSAGRSDFRPLSKKAFRILVRGGCRFRQRARIALAAGPKPPEPPEPPEPYANKTNGSPKGEGGVPALRPFRNIQ